MFLLKHEIFNSKIFKKIISFAKKEKKDIYLVGGFLRDLIIGYKKPYLDLDFALKNNAIDFGRQIADVIHADFFILDKTHGCCRVVYKDKNKIITFDFVDFKGKNIKEDLFKRDFTINSLAIKLPIDENEILDYFGGQKDIKNKIVKVIDNSAFDEDPLRILRAFSISAIFEFKISSHTIKLIEKEKNKLKSIAPERIRDEFFKIFDVENTSRYIESLDKTNILELIIPQVIDMHNVKQGGFHHLDVWEHSLETLRQLEQLLIQLENNKDINFYLDEVITPNRKRKQILKLAALLHDSGKPEAFKIKAEKTMFYGHERIGKKISDLVSKNLKLSFKEKKALNIIILWHLRPGSLADAKILTKRAEYRFFRDTTNEAINVLLLSIADSRATRGLLAVLEKRKKHEKIAFSLIDKYFKISKQKPIERLINGNDLIKKLKLTPGPIFSKILHTVLEAQVERKIKTKKDALIMAKKMAEKFTKK